MLTLKSPVFLNGNSQVVRIPAEFRLDTDQVQISRNEQGDLIIHPLKSEGRGQALLRALEGFDEEFITAMEENLRSSALMQDRETL